MWCKAFFLIFRFDLKGTKMHEAINFGGMKDKYKSADAYLQSRIDTADKDGKYYTEDPVMTRKLFNLNVDLVNMLIDRGVEFVEGTKSVSHVLAPGDFKGTSKFANWRI